MVDKKVVLSKIFLLLGVMLLVQTAYASVCSDFTFTMSPQNPLFGQSVRVTLTDTNNDMMPPGKWTPYTTATITTSPGITVSGTNNPLSLQTTQMSYQWTVTYVTQGTYDINADITGASPDCHFSLQLNLNQSQANLTKTLTVPSEANLNEDFNIMAELNNPVGAVDATDVTEDPSMDNSIITPGLFDFPSAITGGSSASKTFTIKALSCGMQSINSITTYKENGESKAPINQSKNIDIKGSDFIVSDILFSNQSPSAGETIDINVYVKNTGEKNQAGSISVQFLLNGQQRETKTITDLNANETKVVTFTLNTTGLGGSNTVLMKTDSTSAIYECSETNNDKSVVLNVGAQAPSPNIKIQSITMPSTANTNSTITVAVVVKSETTALLGITTKLYLDGNVVLTDTNNFNAGEEKTYVYSFTGTNGTHTVKASTDTANIVAESSETDNNSEKSVVVSTSQPPAPVCGDGSCNGTENCNTCPGDCGTCPPSVNTGTSGNTGGSTGGSIAQLTTSGVTKLVGDARAKRDTVDSQVNFLNSIGYTFSNEFNELYAKANGKLTDSEGKLSKNQLTFARIWGEEAKRLYNSLILLLPEVSNRELNVVYDDVGRELTSDANVDQNMLRAYDENMENKLFTAKRKAIVYTIKETNGETKYITKMILSLKNVSGKKQAKVELIDEVPKQIVENASLLRNGSFAVVKADPVISWTFNEFAADSETEVVYFMDRGLDETTIELFKAPTVRVALSADALCEVINADDNNPCTLDECVNGVVTHTEKDGTVCSDNGVCVKGVCTEQTEKTTNAPTGYFGITPVQMAIGGVAVIIIIVLLGSIALRKKKTEKTGKETEEEADEKEN